MTSSSTGRVQTDEQREMRRTVADLLGKYADAARIREAMTGEPGHDPALWRRAAEDLGLGALLVPERLGGLGMSFADAAVVLEEFGRRVVPSPVLTTLVATAVLAACGTPEADEVLGRIGEEGVSVSLAVAEPGAGWDAAGATTTATATGDGWTLHGRKQHVPLGAAVDLLLVVARDAGGPGLYLVAGDAAGVTRRGRAALDQTRRLAEIDLDGARAVLVSPADDGVRLVALLDHLALVALAVESAAAAQACLEMTVEYLKVREQFGRPLGSFQALKHRCADLLVTVEGAASTAWYAVEAAATRSDELALVAPLARVVCADALMTAAAESIQLHGGIGFTFEHDAHLFFKRGKANQHLWGSGPELRRRVARLAGLDS
jgi:alkylation response protein AidB-like acyl-CoA dehydrogenase